MGPSGVDRCMGEASISDGAILRAAADGSPDAAAELAQLFWPELFRVANLIVRDPGAAEDIAQEALLAALRASAAYDGRRPLKPWLIRITTNRSLDWVRDRSRRPNEVALSHAAERVEDTEADQLPSLQDGLESLDPELRAMVVLRYVLDYRSDEIGEMLGISASTVRTRLARALSTLRVELTEQEEIVR